MNAQQTLKALDSAAMSHPSADGRRVLRNEANELRARIERAQQAAGLRAQMARPDLAHNHSMYAQQLAALGNTDVAGRVAEAQRTLALWS